MTRANLQPIGRLAKIAVAIAMICSTPEHAEAQRSGDTRESIGAARSTSELQRVERDRARAERVALEEARANEAVAVERTRAARRAAAAGTAPSDTLTAVTTRPVTASTRAAAPSGRPADPWSSSGEDGPSALERGRYAVVIDLDENRLHFMQGELTLWSAPVGTGTGMRVITEDNDWDFSTPTGTFEVQFKERDPVWIAPDWYFVENNLPIPPANHTSRYMRGTLGVAAVYISPHLAIHGTQRPDLIGQRVSHGCIRLENRYALRLFHNVQIGTEVIIVGGEDIENTRVVDLREGYDPSLASNGGRPPLPVDSRFEEWKGMATPALLRALDTELDRSSRSSRWDEVAIMLLDRARDDDDAALIGLLRRSGGLPTVATEIEWSTFLADIYRGAALRTLEGLARLDTRERQEVAGMIVEAMITLYHGELDEPSVPWPTSHLPAQMVTREGQPGYAALIAAEREQRDRIRMLAAEIVD